MAGGFGGGSWGGGAFGGSDAGGPDPLDTSETITISEGLTAERIPGPVVGSETITVSEGLTAERAPLPISLSETVTLNEALTVALPLVLVSAVPTSSFLLLVQFSHELDPSFVANFSSSNYQLSPTLDIDVVTPGPTTSSVYLVTKEQGPFTYTLTVATGRAIPGDLLTPPNQTKNFDGFPSSPRFFAAAQGPRKVMLTFSTTMAQGSPFTTPSNYTITDLNGNVIPVTSVAPQGAAPITRATLTLGTDLTKGGYYIAAVNSAVITAAGAILTPPRTDLFQWSAASSAAMTIPFSSFSGEVTSGLLGQPDGLVFFSPALDVSVPNSVIQVDQISSCTRAYDVYTFPDPPDPPALFTFAPGATPAPLGGVVLWAPSNQVGMPSFGVGMQNADTMAARGEGAVDAVLVETVDITRGSFLNDARWKLYPGPTAFKTADNLTPIGPGPTTNLNLQP